MWVLYSTLGCHLCEQAMACITQVLGEDTTITIQDISEDQHLMDAYGVRIPVIKNMRTERELGWPFNETDLKAWLEEQQ